MIDEKKLVAEVRTAIDDVVQNRLEKIIGEKVAESVRSTVDKMRMEKAVWGYDRSGLTDEQKSIFAKAVQAAAFGRKANEELITESDERGGILIPTEVASAIVRVARTVGVAMSQVQQWPLKGDSMTVPAYTGAVLEGEFLGVNAAGSLTAFTFDHANLFVKKWQLAFALGNDLLEDASVQLGEWLVSLAAEALANMVDKQVFNGTGAPFEGILNHDDVTAVTLGTGKNTFEEYAVIEDSSLVIGNLEESLLDGAAFYFSRTVWANLRVQKDDAGQYLLGAGLGIGPQESFLMTDPKSAAGPRPTGYILSYPVYTCRHLPALSATAAATKFGVFGNLKCVAYGEKGNMTVEKYTSGTFGGKEIALADQQAMVIKKRWGTTIALPEGMVTIKTAAS